MLHGAISRSEHNLHMIQRKQKELHLQLMKKNGTANTVAGVDEKEIAKRLPSPVSSIVEKLNIGGRALHIRRVLDCTQENDMKMCTEVLLQFALANERQRISICDYYFELDEVYFFERPPYEADILADYYMIGTRTSPSPLNTFQHRKQTAQPCSCLQIPGTNQIGQNQAMDDAAYSIDSKTSQLCRTADDNQSATSQTVSQSDTIVQLDEKVGATKNKSLIRQNVSLDVPGYGRNFPENWGGRLIYQIAENDAEQPLFPQNTGSQQAKLHQNTTNHTAKCRSSPCLHVDDNDSLSTTENLTMFGVNCGGRKCEHWDGTLGSSLQSLNISDTLQHRGSAQGGSLLHQCDHCGSARQIVLTVTEASDAAGGGAGVEQCNHVNGNGGYENDRPPIEALIYAEYSCVVWFTIEFVTRIIVEVDRREFMRKPLNIIDLLTILPFYAENMLPFIGISAITLKKFSAAMLVMRVLRVARVARIFKLARYSSGLQTIGDTFRQSMQELSMLGMLLTTGIIFFATVTYFLEKDEPKTGFKSIPAACWWCVITMTTVGYGDVVPVTSGGKLVATMASISGIVVLAFPISMIVEKFAVAQETMAAEQKKKALLAGIHVSPSGTPAPPSAPPGANSAEAPQKMRRAFGGKFGGRRRKPPPTPYTPAAQSEQINNRA